MAESKMPARIWATCSGMSTRLPDGHRQFIGGWSEYSDRPRAIEYVRADAAEELVKALEDLANVSRSYIAHMDADDIASLDKARSTLSCFRSIEGGAND